MLEPSMGCLYIDIYYIGVSTYTYCIIKQPSVWINAQLGMACIQHVPDRPGLLPIHDPYELSYISSHSEVVSRHPDDEIHADRPRINLLIAGHHPPEAILHREGDPQTWRNSQSHAWLSSGPNGSSLFLTSSVLLCGIFAPIFHSIVSCTWIKFTCSSTLSTWRLDATVWRATLCMTVRISELPHTSVGQSDTGLTRDHLTQTLFSLSLYKKTENKSKQRNRQRSIHFSSLRRRRRTGTAAAPRTHTVPNKSTPDRS